MPKEKLSRSGKTITAGDFAFEQEGWFVKRLWNWWFNKDDYETTALDMMERHYQFYGQMNKVNGISDEDYVTREAIIDCSLGTNSIKLDAYEDHGILAPNDRPLMTCEDCKVGENIYHFGTCDCKNKYSEKLPHPSKVGEPDENGNKRYQCFPVLSEKWKQKNGNLLIGNESGEEFAEALMADAFLTCIYGGYISVVGLSRIEESKEENISDNLLYELSEQYIEWLMKAEGGQLYPYRDTADKKSAQKNKTVSIGPGITFDKTGTHWNVLKKHLQWSDEKINEVIDGAFKGIDYSNDPDFAITYEQAKDMLWELADTEYIPDLNAAIIAYRENNEEEIYFYTQRELEAMFDFSYNTGLKIEEGWGFCPYIESPNYIIYYYLRKDLEGAVTAVEAFGNEGERRRINQMYLFFEGYEFLDKSGDGLASHRKILGFSK